MTPHRTCLTLTACLLLSAGCGRPAGPLADTNKSLREQVRDLQAQMEQLDDELREAWGAAFCRPEVRQLLEDVQKECGTSQVASRGAGGSTCTTKSITPAVIDADPRHKGRFLTFMTSQRHEAFYLGRGQASLSPWRLKRLRRLVRKPLRTTRFLVVSHPVPGEPHPDLEASQRAEVIISQIRGAPVPAARILRWIYAYPVSRGDIDRFDDLPRTGEPADLNRSVWVFRVDC